MAEPYGSRPGRTEHLVVIPPPPTRRTELVDHVGGFDVADPYRWLEDGEATETVEWVAAQNHRTRHALDALPDRRAWHERLAALLGAPTSAGARVAGELVFALERVGEQAQHRLVVRDQRGSGPARVVIDPTALAADGTAAIDWYHPSQDGALVAYGVSEAGDERSILRIVRTPADPGADDGASADTAPILDEIPECRAASIGWMPDASGFLYTVYPAGQEYGRHVRRHVLGRPAELDELIFDDPDPQAWPSVEVSADGRLALVTVNRGWSRTDVYLLDLHTAERRTIVEGVDGQTGVQFDFCDGRHRLVGSTSIGASNGRVIAVLLGPVDDPLAAVPAAPDGWVQLVSEGDEVISGVLPCGDEVLVATTRNACSRLHRYGSSGEAIGTVELGGDVTLAALDTTDDGVAVLQIEGFDHPARLHRWTAADGLEPLGEAADGRGALAPALSVRYTTYRSLDGTEIGLFLIHRADVEPDPDTACILTGYGGFAISLGPAYGPGIVAWCERGGLYAVAGLRGGLEHGEAWHQAGMRANKQRVFDDMAAAAEHLVAEGLTSPARLALRGGSNGGLLVGAVLTQRPELARAVHCAVPLLDMVRYHLFLIGRLWIPEYGDPDVPDELAWLYAYSPYHHVVEGTTYPAVLITTAESDSRVDPLHARKMAALLQWAGAAQDERPVLLRVEERAGHGVGKPLAKQADELADVLAFLAGQLGGLPA